MDHNTIGVFVSAFALSAFAGLAALLRSGSRLSTLAIVAAITNSGMLGLGLSLLWYEKYRDNLYLLIGICLLAGLGGNTTLDFAIAFFKKNIQGNNNESK